MRRRLSSPARATSGNPDENHPSGSRLYKHAAGMSGYKIGSPGMSHTPVNRLYSCGFKSRVSPEPHGFPHKISQYGEEGKVGS